MKPVLPIVMLVVILAGCASPHPVYLPPPPGAATVIPVGSAHPSYCSAAATNACTGCAVSCEKSQHATCTQGTDGIEGASCTQPAQCNCR